jgi:UDP-N-acetylmuramate: L-alanyl-gamma-D-glutamyl-meso-diaminopimelate ligase
MLMHILKSYRDFDYLVGSQLPGFERMVRLSDAPLIVIEGDEYLTSPLDHRPKFVHYKAHAAMITGIAWDHVNVFPTEEIYHSQFSLLIDTLEPGGHLFYFNGDEALKNIAEKSGFPQQKSYDAPEYENVKGGTQVSVNNRVYTLPFYGRHNLQNAAGVVEMASTIGITEEEAWSALETFPGTAKRLEPILETENLTVIRDFAHAPSEVEASVFAVREQFPNHKFIAVFEVHTYSSLNPDFMQRYQGTLNPADAVCVLYDPHVFELKRMEVPSKETIEQRFGKGQAMSDLPSLQHWLSDAMETHQPMVVLLMSSGNLCGLSVDYFTNSKRS